MKICWKCRQKISFNQPSNRFMLRWNNDILWLHCDCYMNLSNHELKQIYYDLKRGPPNGYKKRGRITAFLIGGVFFSAGYARGSFMFDISNAKKVLKEKGMSFTELDDLCIDMYRRHYPLLLNNLQKRVLNEIRNKTQEPNLQPPKYDNTNRKNMICPSCKQEFSVMSNERKFNCPYCGLGLIDDRMR